MSARCLLLSLMGICLLILTALAPSSDYVKPTFEGDLKQFGKDIMTGASLGASLGETGGAYTIVFGALFGALAAEIRFIKLLFECEPVLKTCRQASLICIKNAEGSTSECCGSGWDFMCYSNWQKVIDEIIIRFPDSDFAREVKAQKAAIEANLTTHEILDIAKETNRIVKETHQTLIITQHTVNQTFELVKGTYRLVNATFKEAVEANRKLNEMKKIVKNTNQNVDKYVSEDNNRRNCEAETKCSRCDGDYSCLKQNRWSEDAEGCCPTGYRTSCCETTTTTTTTATTTTTNEKLACRKAVWESNPTNGIQKYENPDKFCGQADRHCYVVNCTIVLDSPEFDGRFFGYRAEWGCIESKASLLANLNQSDGWKGKNVIDASCNPFFGAKHLDMSNHNIDVPIFNTSVLSSLWCKGGHFWMGNQQKKVKVCQKHEHYCYTVNCTLALAAGKSGVMQPEHYVLTKWGCTDNKKSAGIGLEESEAKQLIGQNDSIRYQSHVCSGQVGKANVSMSNAHFEVPTPPKLCKKAYLSKKLGYNDSFAMSCGQSEHYCYVLNCSSSVNGHNQSEVTTEWGCTDSDYTTEDFRLGKGRNWANTFLGPIPKSSTCLSFVDTSSNVDKMIPVIESSNGANLTSKCKRVHLTADGKRIQPKDDCRPDMSHYCYAIHCINTANRNKEIKEWGCTSNMTHLFSQKADEFGFELSHCHFDVGPSKAEITFKELVPEDEEPGKMTPMEFISYIFCLKILFCLFLLLYLFPILNSN